MAENWTKDRKDNSAETEIMASKAPTSLLFFTFHEEIGANVLQSMNDLSSFDNTKGQFIPEGFLNLVPSSKKMN